jgi:hypothetical protein
MNELEKSGNQITSQAEAAETILKKVERSLKDESLGEIEYFIRALYSNSRPITVEEYDANNIKIARALGLNEKSPNLDSDIYRFLTKKIISLGESIRRQNNIPPDRYPMHTAKQFLIMRNAKKVEDINKYGFNDVLFCNVFESINLVSGVDFVMLVSSDLRILAAETYRKAHYPGKKVNIVICENSNIQKQQLGDKAMIY